ncbi:sensor histidine kinase [Clostridium lundense]|uniref:sensor histidine kinase n=1 Tax=Clostridium lundense TaxID=319475 RepID=UPI000489E061|nr:GHKL domain-containing protein [Clostridium lundense]
MIEVLLVLFAALVNWSIFLLIYENLFLQIKISYINSVLFVVLSSIITVICMKMKYIFILSYIFVILMIKLIYKNDLEKSLMQFSIVYIPMNVFEILLTHRFNGVFFSFRNEEEILIIVSIITMLISTVLLIFFKDKLKFKILDEKLNFFIGSSLFILFVLFKVFLQKKYSVIVDNLDIIVVVFYIIFLLQLYGYSYMCKIIEESKGLEEQKKYDSMVTSLTQEIRKKQHEFKNHLNTIKGMIDVSDDEELKVKFNIYVNEVNKSVKKIEELAYINSLIIKGIVYTNIEESKRKDISFNFDIKNNVIENILNDQEMSVVLNNLLNNAFEAVMNAEKRNVVLKIYNENGKGNIIVKNNINKSELKNISRIFDEGYSSKGSGRGYGLNNVKDIVEKNNGKIELDFEDSMIIFKIIF